MKGLKCFIRKALHDKEVSYSAIASIHPPAEICPTRSLHLYFGKSENNSADAAYHKWVLGEGAVELLLKPPDGGVTAKATVHRVTPALEVVQPPLLHLEVSLLPDVELHLAPQGVCGPAKQFVFIMSNK